MVTTWGHVEYEDSSILESALRKWKLETAKVGLNPRKWFLDLA